MLGQWVVEGGPAPPTSQLWKQNFISTLWGSCKIGDYKAFEGRNYSLELIISLRLRGKVEDGGGSGWGSDLKSLHWNADEREDIQL